MKFLTSWGRLVSVILVGLLLSFSPACSEQAEKKGDTVPPLSGKPQQQAAHPVFQSVSALEAQELIKKKKNLILIDVRTPQEIKQMKIPGSLPVPVGDVIRGKFVPPKGSPIMLVCAVGGRSYIAGRALASKGYQEVYNLEGGIEAWYRAGLQVEK